MHAPPVGAEFQGGDGCPHESDSLREVNLRLMENGTEFLQKWSAVKVG
jgi:hypothetical protein